MVCYLLQGKAYWGTDWGNEGWWEGRSWGGVVFVLWVLFSEKEEEDKKEGAVADIEEGKVGSSEEEEG